MIDVEKLMDSWKSCDSNVIMKEYDKLNEAIQILYETGQISRKERNKDRIKIDVVYERVIKSRH